MFAKNQTAKAVGVVAKIGLFSFFCYGNTVGAFCIAVTNAPLFLILEPSFGRVRVKAKPSGCALRSLDPAPSCS